MIPNDADPLTITLTRRQWKTVASACNMLRKKRERALASRPYTPAPGHANLNELIAKDLYEAHEALRKALSK